MAMIFRLYHETRGGHVLCRLFAGRQEGALGKCGDLTMRVEEFTEFVAKFAYVDLRAEHPGVLAAKDSIMVIEIAKRIRTFCEPIPKPFDHPDEDGADRAAEIIMREFMP